MMKQAIQSRIDWLQCENYKSSWLAFLRVAISLWLLLEIATNWSSIHLLYGPSSFIVFKNSFLTCIPGAVSWLRSHYEVFIILFMITLCLNLFGIGRWITALLLFFMLDILQKMNFAIVNGGHMLARMILLYLIFADSYRYFV